MMPLASRSSALRATLEITSPLAGACAWPRQGTQRKAAHAKAHAKAHEKVHEKVHEMVRRVQFI
jgi:hypothetical protein